MNNQQPDDTNLDIKQATSLKQYAKPVATAEDGSIEYFRKRESSGAPIAGVSNCQPLLLTVRMEITHADGTPIVSDITKGGMCFNVKYPIAVGALTPHMFASNAGTLCVHALNGNLQGLQMLALTGLMEKGYRKIDVEDNNGLIG